MQRMRVKITAPPATPPAISAVFRPDERVGPLLVWSPFAAAAEEDDDGVLEIALPQDGSNRGSVHPATGDMTVDPPVADPPMTAESTSGILYGTGVEEYSV